MDLSTFAPLSVPVPPMLEEALGYTGTARLVAFYWTPMGDEAMYDDGVQSGDGEWPAWLSFVQHPKVEPQLGPYDLGSSESEARHWLVLDRTARALYALPVRTAAALLHQQWADRPDAPPVLESPEEVAALLDAITDVANWQETTIDVAAVERRMEEQGARLEALLVWLDQQGKEGSA
jgi:hypothetical protein